MADLQTQIILAADSALPEDVAVNTLHWSGSNVPASVAGLHTIIVTHWLLGIDQYLSSTLSGDVTLKTYDLDDPSPRVPISETTHTIFPGVSSYPREVALVLSYRAAVASGANMRRRRNRIYVGPLHSFGTVADQDNRPASGDRTAILNAFEAMYDNASAAGYTLGVWSEADGVMRDAVFAWIDNAFDTQRRRGRRATERSTRVLV